MRTYVRVERGHDPARGRRLVLRVRRAAGRSEAPRPAGDRRRLGRAGGELRGKGGRRANGDERRRGTPPLSRRRSSCSRGCARTRRRARRCSPSSTTRRRSSSRSRSTRRFSTCAGCGGSPDRPRDRRAAAPRRARARRPADHGRGGADEVPGEGGERRREARRAARRRARPRARLPPPARGRAALGRRAGDGPKAARGQAADSRRVAGLSEETLVALLGRASGRQLYALSREPRRAAGAAGPAPRLDRGAARARPLVDLARGARRHARGARRPHHPPDAGGRAQSGEPSSCGFGSATSRGRRAVTRCPARRRRRSRSSRRRGRSSRRLSRRSRRGA